MKGYQFFAVMPDERKSKGASKLFPFQPWTRATLRTYADAGRYVECLATFGECYNHGQGNMLECIGALQAGNDQAVCGSSCAIDYLRDRCVRIDEALARRLHPALLRALDQANERERNAA